MNRTMIIEELANRGYKAEKHNVIKNGVELEGIMITTEYSNTFPVFYTEQLIVKAEKENQSVSEVVDSIMTIYENQPACDFDVNMFYDKEEVLNHIYIGLQKTSTEEIIKEDTIFDGIESYLFLCWASDEAGCSVKITKEILKAVNIAEEELWERAKRNTEEDGSLTSLTEMINESMRLEGAVTIEEELPVYVITNKYKYKGAATVFNKKVYEPLKMKYHTNKFIVLPSSIHEMLVMPYTDGEDMDFYSAMVKEVNTNQVDPIERLTDKAYTLTI